MNQGVVVQTFLKCVWSCFLYNHASDNQDDSRLQETPSLAEFPNPPGQPRASNISLHAVRLQWDEPDRSKRVTHYQLESHNVNRDLGKFMS